MSTPLLHLPTAHLDLLLAEICRALQLTPAQFDSAEAKYRAVGDWLRQPGTLLAAANPEVYPQGSVATQTTVRPRAQEEFDVDLVCEVATQVPDPMALYNAVGARLSQHAYYRSILKPMKRCWRLNYAGNFHMDVLPAKPDLTRPGNAVSVPDRKLQDWCPSNPKDFARWFNRRADQVPLVEARKTEPLPDNDPADERPPLKRGVQLLKRCRDVYFDGDEDAPRSVVLTTLAGNHYQGQDSVYEALLGVVNGIATEIDSTPGILVVCNPANPSENFAESWQSDELAYRRFARFIGDLRQGLRRLPGLPLADGLSDELKRLFGDAPTKSGLEGYAKRMEIARREKTLRFSPAVGLTTSVERTRGVPPNTFYGR
jgi:hypothetical protein